MLEVILALAVISLAVGGLGLGLVLGRGPALTPCSAADKSPETRCADCPLRRRPDGAAVE
jgi:hypothetical protein